MRIFGTTASGDPYTTLFNTLRSITYYAYIYYLDHRKIRYDNLIAAGDDVLLSGDWTNSIYKHTSRDN